MLRGAVKGSKLKQIIFQFDLSNGTKSNYLQHVDSVLLHVLIAIQKQKYFGLTKTKERTCVDFCTVSCIVHALLMVKQQSFRLKGHRPVGNTARKYVREKKKISVAIIINFVAPYSS